MADRNPPVPEEASSEHRVLHDSLLQGIFIKWVSPESPAAGKLFVGDRILAVNDIPLCSPDHALRKEPGAEMQIDWLATHQFAVQLIKDVRPGLLIHFLVQRLARESVPEVIDFNAYFLCPLGLDKA